MTDVKLGLLHRNSWNHLTMCKKKCSTLFKIIFKRYLQQFINHKYISNIYIHIYVMHSISFQIFLYRHLKLKIQYVIAIHLMRWLTNFYDFRFKWTPTAGIGIHPTKAWLSQLVNFKMQSGREEEQYAIRFCFKLGKMPPKRMECFRLFLNHLAWIEHEFLSSIIDSRKAGSLWGMMRGGGGVRKSIHQSWLAKGLGLGLLCWSFKGGQEEIPSEEASTLQIGSVAFPPRQCTSQQLHPCHRLFDQDGHQDCSSASL